jgi:hypothetical protein
MCRPGYGQPVGVKRKAEPGDTKCLARQKLCFPPRLFSALPSQHRPPLSIIASPTFIGRSITWSPTLLVAAVQQMAAHHAVTVARVLALVHPQIAGNGTHTLRSYRRWQPPMKWEKPDGSAHLDPCLLGVCIFGQPSTSDFSARARCRFRCLLLKEKETSLECPPISENDPKRKSVGRITCRLPVPLCHTR